MTFCRIKARIFSPLGVLRIGQGRNLPDNLARKYHKEGLLEIPGEPPVKAEPKQETEKEKPKPKFPVEAKVLKEKPKAKKK